MRRISRIPLPVKTNRDALERTLSSSKAARDKLNKDIQEFLAEGNTVTQQPILRREPDQFNHLERPPW